MQVYVLTTALLCHHRHHRCLLAPLDWVAPNVGSSEPCQVHRSMWGCGISDHSVQYHIDQRCYTMLGPVSVWVGDRLRAGKPPRRKTRNSGLLSPCLCGRIEWVPGESWESKQAHRVIHQPVSVVSQCGAGAWLKGLASGDQRRLTGSSSTYEACSRWCAVQIHRYLTFTL